MREPPPLDPDLVAQALHIEYGVRLAGLRFLAVGYEVEAASGPAYFLKVRAGTGDVAGVRQRWRWTASR